MRFSGRVIVLLRTNSRCVNQIVVDAAKLVEDSFLLRSRNANPLVENVNRNRSAPMGDSDLDLLRPS
jgi:hypothetical protein